MNKVGEFKMSAFGDNNFKSDVFENLNWIVSEVAIDQLIFLHHEIIEIITNGLEYVNEYILNYINERNLTIGEAKEELSEIYSYIVTNCSND